MFYNKKPNIYSHMVEFGRIADVTIREMIMGRMKPKTRKCIMVIYAQYHAQQVYRLYDPGTKSIITS